MVSLFLSRLGGEYCGGARPNASSGRPMICTPARSRSSCFASYCSFTDSALLLRPASSVYVDDSVGSALWWP